MAAAVPTPRRRRRPRVARPPALFLLLSSPWSAPTSLLAPSLPSARAAFSAPLASSASSSKPRDAASAAAAMSAPSPAAPSVVPPAIVYTIAGSDSGGGAGIQADLRAIHALSGGTCHGCSAITCLTAQNSRGVKGVHVPPPAFLREQLSCLEEDLVPRGAKVGMLGSEELAEEVGRWLKRLREKSSRERRAPFVVVDPVMISTSGHKLIDDGAKSALISKVFPFADLVTPNKFEAEELLGRKLATPREVEEGAREILAMGPGAVLIKGGHSLREAQGGGVEGASITNGDDDLSAEYAQDYLLASDEASDEGKPVEDRSRLCDASRGLWLRGRRHDTIHTHGTGCTLSSAIATAWAMGQRERERGDAEGGRTGSLSSMRLVDACCVAKAYVNAGISRGVGLGGGPGPVVHTGFPRSHEHFPAVVSGGTAASGPAFRPMRSYHSSSSSKSDASDVPVLGRILPIVDTVEWIERLASTSGIADVQLRFKDTSDRATILDRIRRSQKLCRSAGARLWINDHWREAVEAGGCFGVHLGQEDLCACADAGGLDAIASAGLALGISTHSYGELAAALGVKPSYVSLGPVFATTSKDVKFDPQGLETVRNWRELIPPEVPLVAIGGIGDAATAKAVREAGAECVAVIGAVTGADDVAGAVGALNDAME
ncbi:hypothetical protein ACHAWF_008741 [Thalassiosira exigua]